MRLRFRVVTGVCDTFASLKLGDARIVASLSFNSVYISGGAGIKKLPPDLADTLLEIEETLLKLAGETRQSTADVVIDWGFGEDYAFVLERTGAWKLRLPHTTLCRLLELAGETYTTLSRQVV
jgi:hypothetical protein